MRQFFGMSQSGNLQEAVRGLARPEFIMLMSNKAQFEDHVKQLEKLYPGIPSIGCIGMSYDTRVVESGVGVVAFSEGVSAAANVLEEVSTMPVKYIERLEKDIASVGGTSRDTVCIDFCAGNDACALTTMHTSLSPRGISLVGGTGDDGRVSANGQVYRDAVAYGIVRNHNGRVKTYKENIYHPMGNYRFIASQTDKSQYILGALDGKPAKQVYQSILHVTEQAVDREHGGPSWKFLADLADGLPGNGLVIPQLQHNQHIRVIDLAEAGQGIAVNLLDGNDADILSVQFPKGVLEGLGQNLLVRHVKDFLVDLLGRLAVETSENVIGLVCIGSDEAVISKLVVDVFFVGLHPALQVADDPVSHRVRIDDSVGGHFSRIPGPAHQGDALRLQDRVEGGEHAGIVAGTEVDAHGIAAVPVYFCHVLL